MNDEEPSPQSGTGPAVLITLSALLILLGIGRCGMLGSTFAAKDDYGISGAFFIVVGLILLISGAVWRSRRNKG